VSAGSVVFPKAILTCTVLHSAGSLKYMFTSTRGGEIGADVSRRSEGHVAEGQGVGPWLSYSTHDVESIAKNARFLAVTRAIALL